MEPKLKEKQPQHSGFQSAAGEPDKMSTSCLMPKTKRSDTEEKLTTELEEPITVHTSEPDSRQSRFWRLNDPLEASDYYAIRRKHYKSAGFLFPAKMAVQLLVRKFPVSLQLGTTMTDDGFTFSSTKKKTRLTLFLKMVLAT